LTLKEVSSGANITLLPPYDECIHGSRLIEEGIRVTGPVHTYLDFVSMKGRGEEAVSALLEGVNRTSW